MANAKYETIDDLHDRVDEVAIAWDDLAIAVGRRLEGYNDSESRIRDAHQRLRLATGAANGALDQMLAKAGI